MEELSVNDIQFLHGCQAPTVALLHQDVHGGHNKARQISFKDKVRLIDNLITYFELFVACYCVVN